MAAPRITSVGPPLLLRCRVGDNWELIRGSALDWLPLSSRFL